MILPLIRRMRACNLRPQLADQREFYKTESVPKRVRDWQLDQFNRLWPEIYQEMPYFQQRVKSGALPRCFQTWQEFGEMMPVMDKKQLQSERALLVSSRRAPDYWQATGGSTAEPVQIPKWDSEGELASQDIWYARSWFGIEPSDKLFLFWGHSHLLGRGYKGWINARARRAKDSLLGYYRYSAYDLSDSALRGAADALLQFRPAYVLGYAVALDRFARVNEHRRNEFHNLRLKAAIATAECFPTAQSADLTADVLGCPVAMEYGSVETGPLAHQRRSGMYSVFWRRYFLEGRPSAQLAGAYEIHVTSLFPRCLPLIRYKVGDLIFPDSGDDNLQLQFRTVVGRCNDYVVAADGTFVHSEAFTHVVKDLPSMAAYQVTQSAGGGIVLNYVANDPLSAREVDEIRRRLHRINPGLADVRIDRVASLDQTLAGKAKRIVREGLL